MAHSTTTQVSFRKNGSSNSGTIQSVNFDGKYHITTGSETAFFVSAERIKSSEDQKSNKQWIKDLKNGYSDGPDLHSAAKQYYPMTIVYVNGSGPTYEVQFNAWQPGNRYENYVEKERVTIT